VLPFVRPASGVWAAPMLIRGRLAVLGAAVVLLVGCTTHRVGPARTYDDFERKARTTAEDSLSAVETVRLLAEVSASGDAFGPYLSVSVSEQEDTLAGIEGDFASIQPPGPRSDALRDELTPILDAASTHVADVRVAIRRGNLRAADSVAAPLSADADALRTFLEQLG